MTDEPTDDESTEPVRRKPRWNTDTSFLSGPGSDAGVGFVYDIIKWVREEVACDEGAPSNSRRAPLIQKVNSGATITRVLGVRG